MVKYYLKEEIIINCLTQTAYKVAGYIRLSKEDENTKESESVTNQRTYITNYCANNGYKIVDFYIDDGFSGGNFDRPSFKRLIHDIEKGLINMVITKDTSRLGRDFIETGQYLFKYFPEHNVRYLALLENFDTFNPNGNEDFIPFQTIANDFYLKDISRKVTSIRHQKMKDGLFVGSSVPYGYKRSPEDNRKFLVDEYAANIVKRIFHMKLEGKTSSVIAEKLTTEKILPPNVYAEKKIKRTLTTNMWKPSSVDHILKNEVYIGTLIQGMYKMVSYKSKKKVKLPREQWIIKEKNHEPIIEKDIFYRVQEMVNAGVGTRNRKYDFLLKGLVYCKECGKPMTVRRQVRKYKDKPDVEDAVFCCSTYAQYGKYKIQTCTMHYNLQSKLNPIILEEVRKILSLYKDKSKLEKKYDSINSKYCDIAKYEKEHKENLSKISVYDKAISDLYVDRANGLLNDNDFLKLKETIEDDKNKLILKNVTLSKMLDNSKSNYNSNKKRDKLINEFLKMKKPTKAILNQLIDKIEIDDENNIQIYFNFSLKGVQ